MILMNSLEIVNELIYKCNDFLGDYITCISKEDLELKELKKAGKK